MNIFWTCHLSKLPTRPCNDGLTKVCQWDSRLPYQCSFNFIHDVLKRDLPSVLIKDSSPFHIRKLFGRPKARVVLVHPLDKFAARRGPTLDPPLQN